MNYTKEQLKTIVGLLIYHDVGFEIICEHLEYGEFLIGTVLFKWIVKYGNERYLCTSSTDYLEAYSINEVLDFILKEEK